MRARSSSRLWQGCVGAALVAAWLGAAGLAWAEPVGPTAPGTMSPEEFAERAERLDRWMPPIPLTEAAAAWTRDARIVTWLYANSGTYVEIDTPEEAARRADEIAAAGFNTVMISGAHYRQAHRQPERLDEIIRCARLAVEACHARGLKVIDHNDFSVFWSEGYDLLFEHPEWLQVDVPHGRPVRRYCPNDPGYTRNTIDYLVRFQRETGVDAFMIDEIDFYDGACGCEDCRAAFREATGAELPRFAGSPVLFNDDDPLWRLWVRWRKRALGGFVSNVVRGLQEVNPDIVLLTYSTAFVQASVNTRGGDMFTKGRVAQFPGHEGTNVVFVGYPHLTVDLGLRLAVAQAWDRYSWAQFPARSDPEREASMFLAALTGHAPWVNHASTQAVAEVLTWPHWSAVTHPRRPVADVGLVFSIATRDNGDLAAILQEEEYFGWGEMLTEMGVMYQPILDEAAEDIDLSSFRVVVVPGCESLPAALTQRLAAFAAGGGTVIATGPAGREDAFGFPRRSNELAEAVGLRSLTARGEMRVNKVWIVDDLEATVVPTQEGRASLGLDAERVTLPHGTPYEADYALRPLDRVLMRFDDGSPAMVESPVGQGRVIHLALLPGRATYQPKSRVPMPIEPWINPQARQLMHRLITSDADDTALSRIEGERVIGSIFREDDHAVVHLLNVGGVPVWDAAHVKPGDELDDEKAVPAYPAVGPIEVTVNFPGEPGVAGVSGAQWLDPDSDQAVALELEPHDGGVKIRVPAGALGRYAAIRLTLSGVAMSGANGGGQ